MKKISLFSFILIFGLLFTGCATTTMQTKAKLTRTISLSPSYGMEEKIVLLRVSGTTASILELEEPLKKELLDNGFKFAKTEDEANLFLHVNTLFADNLKEANNYSVIGASGATAGILAKQHGNSSADSILIGVAVAIGAGIVNSAMADETYRAVIDINIKEKNKMNEWGEEQKTRLITEAVRANLKREEAKPEMERLSIERILGILI